MSFTSVTLSGTIKKDAQQKFTPNNTSVVSFMMDTLRYDGKAKEEKAYPVKVNMWGDSFTDMVPELTQGIRVVVMGRLQIEQYTDKTGKNVRVLCIEANRVSKMSEVAAGSKTATASSFDEDDLTASAPKVSTQTDAYADQEVPF